MTRKNNSCPLLALISSQKSDSLIYLFLQIRNKFYATLKPLRTLLNLSRTPSQAHGGCQRWVDKACSEKSLWVKVLLELIVLFRFICFALHLYSSFSEHEKSFLFLDETASLHYIEFSSHVLTELSQIYTTQSTDLTLDTYCYFWLIGWCYLWLPFGRTVFTVCLDRCFYQSCQKGKCTHFILSISLSRENCVSIANFFKCSEVLFLLLLFFCACFFLFVCLGFLFIWLVFVCFLIFLISCFYGHLCSFKESFILCNYTLFGRDFILSFPSKSDKIRGFYWKNIMLRTTLQGKKCKYKSDIICKRTATFVIYRKLVIIPEISCVLPMAQEVFKL